MKKNKTKGLFASIVLGVAVTACAPASSCGTVTVVDRPDIQSVNTNYIRYRAPLRPLNFIKLPVGSIQPEGWVKKYLELQRDGLTGHLGEISAWLEKDNNAWLTTGGDHGWEEVPYWLKGYGNLAYILNDPKMIEETKYWIEGVFASRQPDGYFGPVNERNGKRELWAQMIMLWCLQSYYEYSQDQCVIDLMTNYFKWQMTVPAGLHRGNDRLDGRRWTDAVSRRRNYKMEYIRITKENIDKEHICCAMSGQQSLAKKEWLKQRFEEGLVFYRSAERGKCFIEYIPAENAWVPIDADGYLYINCLWVSGSLKGHGYSSELLEECLRDAKAQGKNGVCILCAEGRKREFLADPKFLTHKGFKVSDTSDCGINLMYLPLAESAPPPKFKDCAKHPKVEENGFVLYYTDQCPYTYYWVPKVQEAAKEHGIPFKAVHITEKETAQNVPAPVTTYALFREGKFVTQSIQSDKKFLKLAAE